jgi:hypothetical protein
MQQTENYNLSLIEAQDQVDWQPLNDNFTALDSAVHQVATGLGSVGKNARVVWGQTTLDGSSTTFTFDFKPIVFIITRMNSTGNSVGVVIRDCKPVYAINSTLGTVSWGTNSVTVGGATGDFGTSGKTVAYAAIGVDA